LLTFIKMKKDIEKIIEIPKDVEVKLDGNKFVIVSKDKKLERVFEHPKVAVKIEDNKIILSAKKATKRELTIIGTIKAHLLNMIEGVQKDYTYKMEICNVHFPMTVGVEGSDVVIKNFLGEKTKRVSKILPNVKVQVKGNEITISSSDKESAGQTAANLEKATKIKNRDRRVFQDGVFITEKCGVKI